jgi:Ca2+-binding EF-hand superfamily protein
MGKNVSKHLKELMDHPESESEARKVFASLDGDNDGSLSLNEWNAASDMWW